MFDGRWLYAPPLSSSSDDRTRPCVFCSDPVWPDPLFEDFGFSVAVCRTCLRKPECNLVTSNSALQPRWRPRRTADES
jgi:hypothetical protein